MDQRLPAAEVAVCPMCGASLEPHTAGPAVVDEAEWAADDLLPALAVMSCPNLHCPAKDWRRRGHARLS